MKKFPIGVVLESFNKPLKEGVALAGSYGAKGVQVYATHGGHEGLSLTTHRLMELPKGERKQFLDMVKDKGMVVSAVCAEVYYDVGDPENDPAWIEGCKRVLEFAKELETNIVTTHIGTVPEDTKDPRYAVMQDTCGKLAAYADSMKAHFAIETGSERSAVLKAFLDSLHSRGVAVNMDPANLVMLHEEDPVQAVHTLKDYIVHTHAKDGVMLHNNPTRKWFELPLGMGDVNIPTYLAALEAIGYEGFLTIEREEGNQRAEDIRDAVAYLEQTMKG